MIGFNYERLKDRIYACWIGKNIGGTMHALRMHAGTA